MSVVYVDTSAVLKRAVAEIESEAVRGALRRHHDDGDLIVTSSLAWLEVWRALRRLGHGDLEGGTRSAMSGVDEFPLDDAVLEAARRIGADDLRSLDAIHLASAVMVGAHTVMTFDSRLARAARVAGIAVAEL